MHGGFGPGPASGNGSPPLGAGEGPFFFLSYAHSPWDDRSRPDPDLWIGKLYDDLCELVKELAGLPSGARPGFMDRDLRQGQEWPDQLANALATCRVFVPLYSHRYFRSEHCGKEWFAFNRRRLNLKAKNANPVETIVPALWIPVHDGMLPEAATSVQYNSHAFGELYAEHGFFGIMKVSRWREAYEEAVYLLARQIVTAAAASPLAPGERVPYESLHSAFGGTARMGPGDRPLRITIVAPSKDELPGDRDPSYYGKNIVAWNPYGEDSVRPLADHAAELARSLSYTPEAGDLFRHEAGLLGREPPSGPEVLLIDPWAAMVPDCREILQQFDSMDSPWVQVIVVWNDQDAQMQSDRRRVREALSGVLPRKLREGRATSVSAVRGVPSLEEFGMVLPRVIAEAARHYLRTASALLPQDPQVPPTPQLRQRADEEGE